MKKNFALILVFLLTFTLVSCSKEYTYKFVNEDGTVLLEAKGKKGSTITAPTTNPTKESTDEFSYEFTGWDKEVGTLESDITFTAQYKETKRKYTYKFLNDDGTLSIYGDRNFYLKDKFVCTDADCNNILRKKSKTNTCK